MAEKYAELRAALDAGPTMGPWTVRYDYVVQATSFDGGRLVPVAQPYGVNSDGTDLFANARMIAAANPDTIRALLAERDALREALEGAWTLIAQLPPTQDRVEIAQMVCAALAQEQGGSDASHPG